MTIKLAEAHIKFLAGALAGMIEGAGNNISGETPRAILYSLSGILPEIEKEWNKMGWPRKSMREILVVAGTEQLNDQMSRLGDAAQKKINEIFPKR